MNTLPPLPLPVTRSAHFDFSGGDLTSDGGVLLLSELAEALGVREALSSHLAPHPLRTFGDAEVAMQKALMLACGYGADDCEGALRSDPALACALGPLASQETMSRRLSAMAEADLRRLASAIDEVRDRVAEADGRTEIVVDVDTTLLPTSGGQEGAAWNFHYSADGYHPILATDTANSDVVAFELRPGAMHCANGAGRFCQGVLAAMGARHPAATLFLRGDAGMGCPEVYEACEREGAYYAVRLKSNARLEALAAPLAESMEPGRPCERCGEFMYAAGSWGRARRVVYACVMHEGRLFPEVFFVVTNMAARPRDVVAFYRKRGAMEQVIGDLKSVMGALCPRRSMAANAFCCQLGVLAYSLLNWLRRLCLPASPSPMRAATVMLRFVKVAARRVSHAGRETFRFCSSYPWQGAFLQAMRRIWELAQPG